MTVRSAFFLHVYEPHTLLATSTIRSFGFFNENVCSKLTGIQQLLKSLGGDITLIFWAAGAAQQVFYLGRKTDL